MNRKECLICLLLFFIACNSNKKQATAYLEKAQKSYEQGEYASAKNNLDSIKKLFPKEFGIQKQGLLLKRRIEIKEQERNLSFCDSLLTVRLAEAETLKTGFLFEKDSAYDDTGKYIDKSQRVEARLQSSYIRTIVNEAGEMQLSGVYYGNHPIHQSQLKVYKSNGEYAETADIPYDGGLNYSFVDEGMTTEIVTYTKGKDNGVIQFIYNNKESELKAELIGKGKYTFTISAADKSALAKTFDFAVILSDIDTLKKEKEKASQRLMYLENKLTSGSTNDSE
ncbi:MAG: hypothetical protein FWF53_05060 [Candidatus Azobacteroides sp.]|nr:hypothetical protein [Candidatus Azobacteroides sp.]